MRYHLRLCKALSYKGVVSATKKRPDVFVEDKPTADKAVATGYFKLITDTPEEQEAAPKDDPDYEYLEKLTKQELFAYAKEHGIDISDCKTKADILQEISVANGGSYTMMDLQEV